MLVEMERVGGVERVNEGTSSARVEGSGVEVEPALIIKFTTVSPSIPLTIASNSRKSFVSPIAFPLMIQR